MKELDFETNTPDFIPDGETHTVREGQYVLEGPAFVEGELKVAGHLIIK